MPFLNHCYWSVFYVNATHKESSFDYDRGNILHVRSDPKLAIALVSSSFKWKSCQSYITVICHYSVSTKHLKNRHLITKSSHILPVRRDAEISNFIGLELRQGHIRLAVSRAQPNHVSVVRDVLVGASGIGNVILENRNNRNNRNNRTILMSIMLNLMVLKIEKKNEHFINKKKT